MKMPLPEAMIAVWAPFAALFTPTGLAACTHLVDGSSVVPGTPHGGVDPAGEGLGWRTAV